MEKKALIVMSSSKSEIRKQILVFLAFTFGLSAIFYTLMIVSGSSQTNNGLYVVGLMWCPGVAALITTRIFHLSNAGLGWSMPGLRPLAIAYLLPLVYGGIPYLFVWLTGLGGFNPAAFPGWWYVPFMGTVGVMQAMLTALGEEIGWRGFLVPRLAAITGFQRTALISGAIWLVWHMPVILGSDYRGPAGVPVLYSLLCFGLMVLGFSFAYAWLRLSSASLWPAALLHASHNLFIQAIFDPLTTEHGITGYLTGEFGLLLAISGVVVGFLYRRIWIQKLKQRASESSL